MHRGKYYITPKSDPFFNMAFDEWLFERLRSRIDDIQAVIRLYSWSEPAITFGYNQDISRAIDFGRLHDRNLPIIRRITGGRAIYHDPDELTYTVMLDLSILPEEKRSVSASSRMISEIFVEMFDQIGVSAEWVGRSDNSFREAGSINLKSCFDSLSRYEILSDRAKIAAGAQRQIGGYFIQQGSLKVNGVTGCEAIGQTAREPMMRANDESDWNGSRYTIDDFAEIFGELFSSKLRVDVSIGDLDEINDGKLKKFVEKFLTNKLKKR